MPSFKGQFEHSVDAKGRVAFPAKLRKVLNPEAQERFTIVRGLESCLYLYPEDEWHNVEKQFSSKNSFKKKDRLVKRTFLRYAEDISLDGQNRIAIPAHLSKYAEIDTKAVFLGMGEFIEIWDPEKLDEMDESMDADSIEEIFEQVMGGNSEGNDH